MYIIEPAVELRYSPIKSAKSQISILSVLGTIHRRGHEEFSLAPLTQVGQRAYLHKLRAGALQSRICLPFDCAQNERQLGTQTSIGRVALDFVGVRYFRAQHGNTEHL